MALDDQEEWNYTYYTRDAPGNVTSIYKRSYDPEIDKITQLEVPLYGSSRLSIHEINKEIAQYIKLNNTVVLAPMSENKRILGLKKFEMTNHLGNLLSVISDRKLSINTGDVNHYVADVVSFSDYYPFGMLMPERNGGSDYRYGMNGMEQDDEVSGKGNSLTTPFRMYNPRLGRWMSTDPITHPQFSPYSAFDNNPIYWSDPSGADSQDGGGEPKDDGTAKGGDKKNGYKYHCDTESSCNDGWGKMSKYSNSQYAAMAVIGAIHARTTINTILENGIDASNVNLEGAYFITGSNRYITDTEEKSAARHNMYVNNSSVFIVDESNAKTFLSFEAYLAFILMDNFKYGNGPENYYFTENSPASKLMLDSKIVRNALADFNKGEIVYEKQYGFGLSGLALDLGENLTISTLEGLVGSGTITIVKTAKGLKIQIFNITSLTSGAIGKEAFPESKYPKSIVRDPNKKTKYGNISQMFNIFIPNEK